MKTSIKIMIDTVIFILIGSIIGVIACVMRPTSSPAPSGATETAPGATETAPGATKTAPGATGTALGDTAPTVASMVSLAYIFALYANRGSGDSIDL